VAGSPSWEYGVLKEAPDEVYSWDAGPTKALVEAKGLQELYGKLGGVGQLPADGRVPCFDLLGSQGWELAQRERFSDAFEITWFKRPKQ
jgi:hypothetical protein